MAGKNLHADIILGAKTDGFNAAMAQINKLGYALSGISKAAQDLLKESTETYKGYEDNMLTVRAVLNSGKDSASQLATQMNELDKAAQRWAASTIFNTTDVSKALVDAARAGWSYDQMMTGIPAVMNMAQAAGMSLAESMEYFVPVMNATGTKFEDGTLLIDKWVQSANNAPTTVSEIGEAIQNMGAISRMFASDNEMFTLLDMLALNGTTGSAAGTALRNQIARLYAPTKVAKDAMDELGISVGELFDEGESLTSADEALKEYGLSAYDASGNMRPLLDVYRDIGRVMSGKSEKEVNEFLKTVFGTRQYAVAYTLLQSVIGGYDDLYGSIENAAGSAEDAGDIMTSGLTGSMTRLSSKWEEFQLQIGEKFAPTIEGVAGMLGGMVDTLNGMDDVKLAMLTDSLTAIAGLAPTLLLAGGAARMFAILGPQGTTLLLAATAIGAIAGAVKELNKEYREGMFGSVELDNATIQKYLDNQKTIYDVLASVTQEGASTVAESAENVENLSKTLNEKMLTYIIGGAVLSEGQIEELKSLGGDIVTEVQNGIQGAKISSTAFFSSIFGDSSIETQMVAGYYDSLSNEAAAIGETLRSQMVAALEDGDLNGEERNAINATLSRLHKIEAEIQAQQDKASFYANLERTKGASLSSASELMTGFLNDRAANILGIEDLYAEKVGVMQVAYENALANGDSFVMPDGTTVNASDVTWESIYADIMASKQAAIDSENAKANDLMMATLDALIGGTSGAAAWEFLKGWDGSAIDMSNMSFEEAQGLAQSVESLWEMFSIVESTLGPGTEAGKFAAGVFGQFKNKGIGEWGGANLYTQLQSGYLDNFADQKYGIGVDTGTETPAVVEALPEAWEEFANDPNVRNLIDMMSGAKAEGNTELYNELLSQYIDAAGSLDLIAPEYRGDAAALLNYSQGEADGSSYASGVQSSLNNAGLHASVTLETADTTVPAYAEGGRATSASIFGEAGAEWAIPEEHSDRTASLIDAARAASGFTWGELISRNGGLNDGGRGDMTINYSPVINASDAGDVESVLQRDKKNLQRMMAEMLDKFGVNNLQGAYV